MKREYIFVHRIDKQSEMDEHIPLHMTALHWFQADIDAERLVENVRARVETVTSITTTATSEDMFGPHKDIPVVRLERTTQLLGLHLSLLEIAKNAGAVLDERWVGADKWNPHVTHQRDGRLDVGAKVQINDLDVITKRSDGMREMIARIALGDS